jgi:hypothetical protein
MVTESEKTDVASAAQPAGGLPLTEKKQQFSLAYVGIVVAAAGCWVKHHTTDYDGVDITIASSAEYETELPRVFRTGNAATIYAAASISSSSSMTSCGVL